MQRSDTSLFERWPARPAATRGADRAARATQQGAAESSVPIFVEAPCKPQSGEVRGAALTSAPTQDRS